MRAFFRELVEHKLTKLIFLVTLGVIAALLNRFAPTILALFGVEPEKAVKIGARIGDYFAYGVLWIVFGIGFVIILLAIVREVMKSPSAVPTPAPPRANTHEPIAAPVLEDPDKEKIDRLFPQAMKIGDPFEVKVGPMKGSGRCIRRQLTPGEGVLFTIRYSDGTIRDWEWLPW